LFVIETIAREKLSLAITCVSNAERTLNDFLDFLKNDKYKVWNQDQISKREALLKSMIGKSIIFLFHFNESTSLLGT
jgi:hypothetical protein